MGEYPHKPGTSAEAETKLRLRETAFGQHLEELKADGAINYFVEDNLVAIHLYPETFPLRTGGAIAYIQLRSVEDFPGSVIIFAGAEGIDDLGHEGLLEIALEEVTDVEEVSGGGHLRVRDLSKVRDSHAFGAVSVPVLEKFQTLLLKKM